MTGEPKKIVIVGAGVTGCSIAYHLAKLGVSCTVVERESIAERASGKAWAMSGYPFGWQSVEMDPSTYFYNPNPETGVQNFMELYASGYYRQNDIALDIKNVTSVDVGYLESLSTFVISEDEIEESKEHVINTRKIGATELHFIDKDQLAEHCPGISSSFGGALVEPGWTIEPYKYTLGLVQTAEQLVGTTVKTGEVTGFGYKNNKVNSVKLSSGMEIEADAVVIAMGPWSDHGSDYLGCDIPMGPVLEQCIRLEYDKPLSKNMVFNGLAGFIPKPEGDYIFGTSSQSDEPLADADEPVRLDPEHKFALMDDLLKIYPNLEEAKIVEHRGDYMSWSPEEPHHKPVIGRLPNYDNAYIAARISVGMMASAGVGRIMSEYILTGKPPAHYTRLLNYLSPTKAIKL